MAEETQLVTRSPACSLSLRLTMYNAAAVRRLFGESGAKNAAQRSHNKSGREDEFTSRAGWRRGKLAARQCFMISHFSRCGVQLCSAVDRRPASDQSRVQEAHTTITTFVRTLSAHTQLSLAALRRRHQSAALASLLTSSASFSPPPLASRLRSERLACQTEIALMPGAAHGEH